MTLPGLILLLSLAFVGNADADSVIAPDSAAVHFIYTSGTPDPIEFRDVGIVNIGVDSLFWTLTKYADWIDVLPAADTLGAGESRPVVIALNSDVPALAAGFHADTLRLHDDDNPDDSATIVVELVVNRAPVMTEIDSQTVVEGDSLGISVTASDPDGPPPPVLTVVDAPENSSFEDKGDGTGIFVFKPSFTQSGVYSVLFIASDGVAADSKAVTIAVIDAGNQPPEITVPGPQSVAEGESLGFPVTAFDPDGPPPSLDAANGPENSGFVDNGDGSGVFTFDPDYTQSGTYTVYFTATDDSAAVSTDSVVITVDDAGNQPPEITVPGPQWVTEGESLGFQVSAIDPDEDALELTAENMPANALFTDNGNGTGDFDFNPDYTQAGVYAVRFIVSDGALADTGTVDITVTEGANRRPVIIVPDSQSVDEGDSLDFEVSASDPDGTIPELTAEDIPDRASFVDQGDGTGRFDFNPDYTDAGVYYVRFIASDGELADTGVVAVGVNNVNRGPVALCRPVTAYVDGDCRADVVIDDGSWDPDGDSITLTQEPAGPYFLDDSPIEVALIVTDTFGASDTCLAAITLVDSIVPNISCPIDLIISCSESTDPSNTGSAAATDNCDAGVVVLYSDSVELGSCMHERVIIRTWYAEDGSGNRSECRQTITIVDDVAPQMTCPSDRTVNCGESTEPAGTGTAVAEDNCDAGPVVSYSDLVEPGACPQEMVITRTWYAEDACGNRQQCDQIISVIDTTRPSFLFAPAGYTASCGSFPDTVHALAIDNCDSVLDSSFTETVNLSGCGGYTGTVNRAWTFRDDCQNEVTWTQVITIVDQTAPRVTECPLYVEVRSYESRHPDRTGYAKASDDCDTAPAVTWSDSAEPGACPSESLITRVWTATDACGNSDQCLQTIRILNTDPELVGSHQDQFVTGEGQLIGFTVTVEDLDNDPLDFRYYFVGDPRDSTPRVETIEDQPGSYIVEFSWIPGPNDAGQYYTDFSFVDPCGDMLSHLVSIVVGDVNSNPVLIKEVDSNGVLVDIQPRQWIWSGSSFDPIALYPNARDFDEDYPLIWKVSEQPSCVTFAPDSSLSDYRTGYPPGEFVLTVPAECIDSSFSQTCHFECRDQRGGKARGSIEGVFTQVSVFPGNLSFGNVMLGFEDTVSFRIVNPHKEELLECSFSWDDAGLRITRQSDGSLVKHDVIPEESSRTYNAIWSPLEEGRWEEHVCIKAESIPGDSFDVRFSGTSSGFELVPEVGLIDFHCVNSVDIRGYKDTTIAVDVVGGDGVYAIIDSVAPRVGPITVVEPVAGTRLDPSVPVPLKVRASGPRADSAAAADVWFFCTVYVGDEPPGRDSTVLASFLLTATATGRVPSVTCLPCDSAVLEFGDVPVTESRTEKLVIANGSPVTHVIDAIRFQGADAGYFAVASPVTFPMLVYPGDTVVPIVFAPMELRHYSAIIEKVDSVTWDCSPPNVHGVGAGEDWKADPLVDMGPSIELCGWREHSGPFRIANGMGYDVAVDSLYVDHPHWFVFDPPLDVIVDTLSARSDIQLAFRVIPQKIGSENPDSVFRMHIRYRDAGLTDAPLRTLDFAFVKASGCAGEMSEIPDLDFGLVEVGSTAVASVSIANTGNCSLMIDSVRIEHGPFVTDDVGFEVDGGGTSGLQVQFSPGPDDVELCTATLAIFHNGYPGAFVYPDSCPLANLSMVSVTGTGVDTRPPVIDSVVSRGGGVEADIYVVDSGTGVNSVTVRWRRGDAPNSDQGRVPASQPARMSESLWRFAMSDMAPDSIAVLGYELLVTAEDRIPNDTTAGWFVIPGGFASTAVEMSLDGWCGGHRDSMWHLVSIPGRLDDYSVPHIFRDLSAFPFNANVPGDSWRLVRYNGSDSDFEVLHTRTPENVVRSGEGYWFRRIHTEVGAEALRLPSGSTWPTGVPFAIELSPGWNLIGNPFFFPVFLDVSRIDPTAVSSLMGQQRPADVGDHGQWYTLLSPSSDPLEPWKGYAIMCESSSKYTVYLDPHREVRDVSVDGDGGGWGLPISLVSPGANLGTVIIGCDRRGSDGPDMLDARPISFFAHSPRILLNSDDHGAFVRDIRSGRSVQVWQLDLATGAIEDLTLVWKPPSIAEQEALVLRDVVVNSSIDMTRRDNYPVPSPTQLPPGRFKIYFGASEQVEHEIESPTATRPVRYCLYQNYPNPFNPTTSIAFDLPIAGNARLEVFNLLGRNVATLLDGHIDAGSHIVRWHGKDSEGNPVAAGLYLARLTAGDFRSSIKLALVK